MSTNTNNFSRCKVGDKLWCIRFGDCQVYNMLQNADYPVIVIDDKGSKWSFTINGLYHHSDMHQSLFFSNPNIIAPPEPPRLPDYKEGQWIAVWDDESAVPQIRGFVLFDSCKCITTGGASWKHHCTLEELPAVLERWAMK